MMVLDQSNPSPSWKGILSLAKPGANTSAGQPGGRYLPSTARVDRQGFEYLVKLPLRNDFLVLTAEAEPGLVYLFILAFGKSHEKSGYLNSEEGGESESTSKHSPWPSIAP